MSEEEKIENEEKLQDASSKLQETSNLQPATELTNSNLASEINSSEIKTMEVHHHPQLHHKPKPWKEYLLEGLMIFVAVTMGFFAESLRENITAKEKERVYMKSMIQNLKDDTTQINKTFLKQNLLMAKMDSALKIASTEIHDINKQDTFLCHFYYFFGWVGTFSPNDNTLVQLRNAGGFSIIHKQAVADSIIAFASYYAILKVNSDEYMSNFKSVEEFAVNLIKIPILPPASADPFYHTVPNRVELFTNYDQPLIEKLYSLIRIERGQIGLYKNILGRYKEKAKRLIIFLQKEYHLENE